MVLKPPPPRSEPAQKALLVSRAKVPYDTVAVGDSRIMRIGEPSFGKRGWTFFNIGMSGLSPEDTALQLLFAMERFPVKRVVMGVSFENMTARYPFEFSRYYGDPVLRTLPMATFMRAQPSARAAALRGWREKLDDLFPIGRAGETLRYYRAKWKQRGAANNSWDMVFRPDGTAAYVDIESSIKAGTYDYAVQTNPANYFDRLDSEVRYLEVGKLAEDAKDIYRRMFQTLRERKIPCVAFETVKTTAYQKTVDDSPVLARLQAEWREFYRAESHGSVKFLDAAAVGDCYHAPDFFDATHYLGPTTERLLDERLAEALAALEASTVTAVAAPAAPEESAR
jgi:hypothetical protein